MLLSSAKELLHRSCHCEPTTLEVLSKAIHQHLSVPESGSLVFSCPTTIPILELYENFINVRTAETRSLPFTIVLDTFHPAALPVSAVRIFRSFQIHSSTSALDGVFYLLPNGAALTKGLGLPYDPLPICRIARPWALRGLSHVFSACYKRNFRNALKTKDRLSGGGSVHPEMSPFRPSFRTISRRSFQGET